VAPSKKKKKVVAKSKPAPKVKAQTKSKMKAKVVTGLRKTLPSHLTPLDDRVLVRVDAEKDRTPGGLIIPGTAQGRPNRGVIVAIGRGRRDKKGRVFPLDVTVGDRVLFAEYTGTSVTLEGSDYLILREQDLLGVSTL